MDARKDLLITFLSDPMEARIATRLSTALNCEKPVLFSQILAETETIPRSQTRIAFHGHGDPTVFGSDTLHYSPEEFAAAIINLVKKNPQITDIDLLSCNLGLIDAKGECYVSKVQKILLENDCRVNVNTFMVHNETKDVLYTLFVVGSDESGLKQELMGLRSAGVPLLEDDEFSLDVMRTSHKDLIKLHDAFQQVILDSMDCKVIDHILRAIGSMVSGDKTSEDDFKTEMRTMGYTDPQIAKLKTKFAMEFFPNSSEADGYVKCNLFQHGECDDISDKKYDNVKAGIYMYSGDASRASNVLAHREFAVNTKMSRLSREFAIARSREGRECKDKLANIRKYMLPAVSLLRKPSVEEVVVESTSSSSSTDKPKSAHVTNSMFTHPDSGSTGATAERKDEKEKTKSHTPTLTS